MQIGTNKLRICFFLISYSIFIQVCIAQPVFNNVAPPSYSNLSQSSYNQINQPAQSYPIHPFSPKFISQTGERIAKRITSYATQRNQAIDKNLEAIIQADLFSGGAAGINQSNYGDCWFEAALAALARIPEGQQLISDMITQVSEYSYMIYFPGVNQPVYITRDEIIKENARDLGLWARIMEAAAVKGWPDLVKEGETNRTGMPRVIIGLKLLTGKHAQHVDLTRCPPQIVAQVLIDSLDKHEPMTASTFPKKPLSFVPQVVVPGHAYTVMSYDSSQNVITLRNPWGKNSTPTNRTQMPDLPVVGQQAGGVYDMGGGLIQMSLSTFLQHYHYLARAKV